MVIGEIDLEGFETIEKPIGLNKNVYVLGDASKASNVTPTPEYGVDTTYLLDNVDYYSRGMFKLDLLIIIATEEMFTKTSYLEVIEQYSKTIDVLKVIL